MTAELEVHRSPAQVDLASQIEFAERLSHGSMLPDAYRGKPANVMIAIGLGQAMGLSPAESLYRIAVINGKPAAGAELIAANVRKAGHRLRVVGNEETCTATIIRSDDPDFPFEVTRDMEWAQRMGLATNPNYKKQPGTMLQWRAITAVARLACPEALYGVAYTVDEISDLPARTGGLAAALEPVEQDEPPVAPEQPDEAEEAAVLLDPKSKLGRAMFAAINEAGITDDERIGWTATVVGREITSSKELTEDEARRVIDAAKAILEPQDTPA